MLKNAGGGRRKWPHSSLVSRALCAALLIGFTASITAPLPSPGQASPTFEEIERNATEARDAKRLEDAVSLYHEGLKLKPGWNEGSWYLGTSLYGLKRYAEARDAFLHLALSQPGNGPAWALAGMCEFELRDYPRALEYLSRSESAGIEKNEELDSLVRFRIALLLNREGAFDQAWNRLIAVAATGTYPEVIEALGLCVLQAQLLPSEVPEQDRDLYMRAGEAMYASLSHDNDGAARLFKDLVDTYPNRPNVHNARGAFLMDSDPAEAINEFQRELEIAPSHLSALIGMAKLYLRQGAPEKAIPYARKVVEISPNLAEPHRLFGESLLGSGDTTAAIQELEAAARIDPAFPQTHFLLAGAYKRAGNRDLASREMAEFERLDQKREEQLRGANTPK